MDFRLAVDTVRSPDVAFVSVDHLRAIDINRSPVDGAPLLAVEVVSPSNFAQDMAKKVSQYLVSDSKAAWVVYPPLHTVEVHTLSGVRRLKDADSLVEEELFGGNKFSLSLTTLFSSDPYS